MNKVNLSNNKGYKWFSRKTDDRIAYIKGFLLVDDVVLRENDFLEYICKYNTQDLPEAFKKLDGQFSVVIEGSDYVFAAVDHMRCFPVFYKKTSDGYCVFDEITIKDWQENEVNEDQELMLLSTTFTIENNTLFDNYFQIPAGRYLLIKGDEAKLEKYWSFSYAPQQICGKEKACEVVYKGYEHLFKLCKEIIGDRTVVIPLSGGYDSRLVLNGLLKSGINKDKIITFTCGIKTYDDSRLSKQVAEAVGVKNYYINYNTAEARRFFKKDLKNYALYACGLASVPCVQEWYAISRLVKNGIIKEDYVFMPGYGGVLPGHYIKQNLLDADESNIYDVVHKSVAAFASHKPRLPQSKINELTDEILAGSCFESLNESSVPKDYVECYERFIYMEEQVKYIQNSTRNYEYVNCEWITPFFFKEQYNLWSEIDNSLRLNNTVFIESMNKYFLPKLINIPFTGSKVAKKRKTPQSKLEKLMVFLFKRTQINYLYAMFPYSVYYKHFFKNFYVIIDHTICVEMLQALKK